MFVSVLCFTYNQSAYIKDALNGFVMQQTNFPFVVLVVDDASTDGEQEVIRKFMAEEFDLSDTSVAYEKETEYAYIQYAQHKTNKNCFMVAMFLKENHYSIKKPKYPYLVEWRDNVKYEAICEGDDYWIDPLKLQKQVDFLEMNSEYGMCYTKARRYIQSRQSFSKNITGASIDGFEDLLLNGNKIPNLTTVARKDLLEEYLKEINPREKGWLMGDYPMWLFFSYQSNVKFIDEITAVYRVLDNSASHFDDFGKQLKFTESVVDIVRFYIAKYNLKCEYKAERLFIKEYIQRLVKKYDKNIAIDFRIYYSKSSVKSFKYDVYSCCSHFEVLWQLLLIVKKIRKSLFFCD